MQHLSFGIRRRKSDPAYEKAINVLSEKFAESQMKEPTQKSELLSPEARKDKLKSEFKKNVQLENHEDQLVRAIALLIKEGERHLKADEWDHLLSELKGARKALETMNYAEVLPDILFSSLGMTEAGLRSIDTIARLKYRRKEYEDAVALHVLLATLDCSKALYWYDLGICFQEAGEHQKAIQAYSICRLLDPENIAACIFTAECYLEIAEKKNAKKEYEKAVDLLEKMENKEPWEKHLNYILQTIEGR